MTPCEAELSCQLEAALAAVATLQAENALLRQKVDCLVKRVFGASSEQLSPGQLELLLALPATPAAVNEPPVPTPAPVRSRKERAPRLSENLPVVEEVLEPAAVQAAPTEWRKIGQEFSEQLDYEPGRFLCRRLVRPKYVRTDDRDTSATFSPASTSCRIATICVSVNRLFFMFPGRFSNPQPLLLACLTIGEAYRLRGPPPQAQHPGDDPCAHSDGAPVPVGGADERRRRSVELQSTDTNWIHP